ncbi:hypothetical protein RJ55_07015 [Drechmeria coniospora]|nr:hypothetical protein RJ55_07015 [Drechmeria coniospora]
MIILTTGRCQHSTEYRTTGSGSKSYPEAVKSFLAEGRREPTGQLASPGWLRNNTSREHGEPPASTGPSEHSALVWFTLDWFILNTLSNLHIIFVAKPQLNHPARDEPNVSESRHRRRSETDPRLDALVMADELGVLNMLGQEGDTQLSAVQPAPDEALPVGRHGG